MSIFSKLFGRKKDDFSFDTDLSSNDPFPTSDPLSPSKDPFSATSPSDPFGTPSNSFSSDPMSAPSPSSQPSIPNTTGMPTPSMPPPLDDHDMAPTTGAQIAQNYLRRQEQQQSAQPAQSTSQGSSHNMEVISLKLDAIKTQLEMLNQRMDRIENPKRLWK